MNNIVTTIFLLVLLAPSAMGQGIVGRIVATSKSADLRSTHEPKQVFIIKTGESNSNKDTLFKVIYYVPTSGLRGGAIFLDQGIAQYEKLWQFELSQPSEPAEKNWCNRIDNFVRMRNGKVLIDASKEPVILFRSTQFEGDIKFDGISAMPCMVLKELKNYTKK